MSILHGYTIDDDWHVVANGQWLLGKKDEKSYFIKKFNSPKYPNPILFKPDVANRLKGEADVWFSEQQSIKSQLQRYAAPTGNLVTTVDLFREGFEYYKVTYAVDVASLSVSDIARLSDDKKILLLRTLAHSIRVLHRAGIVHGDLKPDNILVTKGPLGDYITKVIDFDDSYFEKHPPVAEETVGTPNYYSPELAKYIIDGDDSFKEKITAQSDIFGLGLIFHEYLTGESPDYGEYSFPFMQVLDNKPLSLSGKVPPPLKNLLTEMLDLNPNKRPTISETFERLSLSKNLKEIYIQKNKNGTYTLHRGDRVSIMPEYAYMDFCMRHPEIPVIKK